MERCRYDWRRCGGGSVDGPADPEWFGQHGYTDGATAGSVEMLGLEKVALGQITTPSTAIMSDVVAVLGGGSLTLRFEFDRDGVRFRSGVRFSNVSAHRWRAESHCTAWHIEGAYDTIVEVEESAWRAELVDAQPAHQRGLWAIRHLMLYLDSAGCYEVAAESWELLPDERVE